MSRTETDTLLDRAASLARLHRDTEHELWQAMRTARDAGATLAQIADATGYTPTGVRNVCSRDLDKRRREDRAQVASKLRRWRDELAATGDVAELDAFLDRLERTGS